MLDPVGGNAEAYAGCSCYPHSINLVGLQFSECELSFITPNFNREHAVCCGKTDINTDCIIGWSLALMVNHCTSQKEVTVYLCPCKPKKTQNFSFLATAGMVKVVDHLVGRETQLVYTLVCSQGVVWVHLLLPRRLVSVSDQSLHQVVIVEVRNICVYVCWGVVLSEVGLGLS